MNYNNGWQEEEVRHKGQLEQSFNLVSLTHDDDAKPSDLKKTPTVHDGLIVGYKEAWRKLRYVTNTQMTAATLSLSFLTCKSGTKRIWDLQFMRRAI